MANKPGHRRFGNVRKLASGRYQARYLGTDGLRRSAPETFLRKGDAERWLALVEAEIMRGTWMPPEAGEIELAEYGTLWIEERNLAPRTRELYRGLFRNHIEPYLGKLMLDEIRPETVRLWRRRLLDAGASESVAAKAYRLLRAILNTAVTEDEVIRVNPCRIRGFDREPTPERPIATVGQVYQLAKLVPDRFRAFVLFAAFTGLRWGEMVALRRCDLDLERGTVRVPRTLAELEDGSLLTGPPKSVAGSRVVALAPVLLPVLEAHLESHVGEGTEALLFTGPKGAPLRRSNFRRAVKWRRSSS